MLAAPPSLSDCRIASLVYESDERCVNEVRHMNGRGLLLWPVFPLGLAKRDVAAYLRQFLVQVEEGGGLALRALPRGRVASLAPRSATGLALTTEYAVALGGGFGVRAKLSRRL